MLHEENFILPGEVLSSEGGIPNCLRSLPPGWPKMAWISGWIAMVQEDWIRFKLKLDNFESVKQVSRYYHRYEVEMFFLDKQAIKETYLKASQLFYSKKTIDDKTSKYTLNICCL